MKTNMKNASLEDRKVLFSMLNNPHVRLSAMVGQGINVRYYVLDDVTITNQETGEVQQTERLVIRSVEGETYHTMARGLIDSFTRILEVFGDDWDEGFTLLVRQINTSGGKRTFTFDIM